MAEWQPIETAPKDEDMRLLLTDGKKVSIGSYIPYYVPNRVYYDESKIEYSYGDAFHDTWVPTLWQPLPDLPE